MSLDAAVRRLFTKGIREGVDPQQQPDVAPQEPQQPAEPKKVELPDKPKKYHLKKHYKPQKDRLPWEQVRPGNKSVKESRTP